MQRGRHERRHYKIKYSSVSSLHRRGGRDNPATNAMNTAESACEPSSLSACFCRFSSQPPWLILLQEVLAPTCTSSCVNESSLMEPAKPGLRPALNSISHQPERPW